MARMPVIAGNWKMHKTVEEARALAKAVLDGAAGVSHCQVVMAPPYTALSPVSEVLRNTPIILAAQNVHWEPKGAFTGEISSHMIISAGCSHVILGHSERRQYFNETDVSINKKLSAAFRNNLIPVLCIGETDEARENNKTFSVLDKQMEMGLLGLSAELLQTLVLAYEPVWAIGTGKTATNDQAQEVHTYLRKWIEKKFGNKLAKSIRILYGGSVKPNNIRGLVTMPDIDGALVGGASLDPESFAQIVRF